MPRRKLQLQPKQTWDLLPSRWCSQVALDIRHSSTNWRFMLVCKPDSDGLPPASEALGVAGRVDWCERHNGSILEAR
jgi:hypothetical protein